MYWCLVLFSSPEKKLLKSSLPEWFFLTLENDIDEDNEKKLPVNALETLVFSPKKRKPAETYNWSALHNFKLTVAKFSDEVSIRSVKIKKVWLSNMDFFYISHFLNYS